MFRKQFFHGHQFPRFLLFLQLALLLTVKMLMKLVFLFPLLQNHNYSVVISSGEIRKKPSKRIQIDYVISVKDLSLPSSERIRFYCMTCIIQSGLLSLDTDERKSQIKVNNRNLSLAQSPIMTHAFSTKENFSVFLSTDILVFTSKCSRSFYRKFLKLLDIQESLINVIAKALRSVVLSFQTCVAGQAPKSSKRVYFHTTEPLISLVTVVSITFCSALPCTVNFFVNELRSRTTFFFSQLTLLFCKADGVKIR